MVTPIAPKNRMGLGLTVAWPERAAAVSQSVRAAAQVSDGEDALPALPDGPGDAGAASARHPLRELLYSRFWPALY